MPVLHYGKQSCVELEFPDGVVPRECGIPQGEPLSNLDAATTAALAEPLDYPSLALCTTPSDRVVLALGHGVPKAAQLVAVIVRTLVEAGVAPEGISVLQTPADAASDTGDPRRLVAAPIRERITRSIHDPADRRQLAYLAANEAAEEILVNRLVHEADVVLPVGCLRAPDTAGYFGIHGTVFPTFSGLKTQQRFRALETLDAQGNLKKELTAEADHVAWLLGVNFMIQAIPAARDGVLHILAGQSDAVRQRGQELYHAAWHCPATKQAALVVATVQGDVGQQTWENLGQALQTASRFVEANGAVALCCDLSAHPGSALQRLASTSRETALRQIGKDRPADALPGAQIAHALEQHKVFLLSKLDPATVEDLGIVPIAGPDDLCRLVQQYSSCILLLNAPYVTTAD